ncbi:type 2 isopentenyl-diphosphate Delta-isomerase [Bdellovibrionota bacterium FG-1]
MTIEFEGRKKEHIQLALNPAHQAVGLGGLDRIHLVHEALPEFNFDEISLESLCLGGKSRTPYYVAAMTAGHEGASRINQVLAEVCQNAGWMLGVGSQRREFEEQAESLVDHWKPLRAAVPSLTLLANIGMAQVIQGTPERLRRLVDAIQANALVVHANALQEALQPEGTPHFKGAFSALEQVCAKIGVPVVLKETGCGFSAKTLRRFRSIGLAAVDVSGLGGTHWGRIEGARAPEGSSRAVAAQTFAEWGEPTVDSVMAARSALPESVEIWASGGVRTGLDAAKLLALGAHQVGFAKPALEAALDSDFKLRQWMEAREFELRVALWCTGCVSPIQLRKKEEVWKVNAI